MEHRLQAREREKKLTTKAQLLGLLEKRRGLFVSGEDAAEALGVSRAAVWKAVEALRREGLAIEALRGSGYRLPQDSDYLSEEGLSLFLRPGCPLHVLQQVDSTNLAAKRWAMKGAPHGALVVAAQQLEGRGRLGRGFESPPGGLYMSIVLRPSPQTDVADTMLVTAAAAVAVCEAVQQLCGRRLAIKWVNDLFWKGKKCCGILTEGATGLESGSIEYLVVGIGVNYRTSSNAFTPDVQQLATSLYPQGGARVSRAQLAAAIHTRLLNLFETLPQRSFLPEYRKRSLVLGQRVTVMAQPPYEALAEEIDERARLVVRRHDGTRTVLSAGEISVRVKRGTGSFD